jgi:Arc/MetJ-type ribon-helix-helix transcriptional regulator
VHFGGMVIGMATTKITITIPQEQVTEIGALVAAGHAASTSAFVKHAIAIALSDAAGWSEMLGEALQQTGGPLTKKERAWADAILGKKSPRKKKAA